MAIFLPYSTSEPWKLAAVVAAGVDALGEARLLLDQPLVELGPGMTTISPHICECQVPQYSAHRIW